MLTGSKTPTNKQILKTPTSVSLLLGVGVAQRVFLPTRSMPHPVSAGATCHKDTKAAIGIYTDWRTRATAVVKWEGRT